MTELEENRLSVRIAELERKELKQSESPVVQTVRDLDGPDVKGILLDILERLTEIRDHLCENL